MRVGEKVLPFQIGLLFSALLLTPAASATTHFVDVGNGAEFFDRDTGSFSFSGFGTPATTFVAVGDTVVWSFFGFQHSTTSGSCFINNFTCLADGLWDSGTQSGGFAFSRTFNTPGIFNYFCKTHGFFSGQGQIVVLSQPEFVMRIGDQFSNVTQRTGWAGTSVAFTGTLFSRAGFNSPVTLTCANSTQIPNRCPSGPVTVVPTTSGTPFIFPVANDTPGTFSFDILALGSDASQTTRTQQVTLNVLDYGVNITSSNSVVVLSQGASFPITFRVTEDSRSPFGISVSFDCSGLPETVNCVFLRNGTIFSQFFGLGLQPGVPEDMSLVLLAGSSATPGRHNAKIDVNSFLFTNVSLPAVRSRPFFATVIGPVTRFDFDPPDTTLPGTTLQLLVTARDSANNAVINYGGTVRFSSSDPAATLPADYTFVTAPVPENGSHSFPITLNTVGPRSLTITDLATGISSSKVVFVGNLNPNNSVSLSVSSGLAFFRHSAATFNAVVSGAGPTPTGVVRFFEGTKELGSATLSSIGTGTAKATFTTANLPVGDHSVIAVYEGDANYGANFSAAASKARSPVPRCVNNVCPGSH